MQAKAGLPATAGIKATPVTLTTLWTPTKAGRTAIATVRISGTKGTPATAAILGKGTQSTSGMQETACVDLGN